MTATQPRQTAKGTEEGSKKAMPNVGGKDDGSRFQDKKKPADSSTKNGQTKVKKDPTNKVQK